tara:strand:+ start:732 stop:1088 length:357 start_codon:yes stop_codon:yes gene_type:complete
MNALEDNIQNWVKLDNKIKKLSSELKLYRNEKSNLSNNIVNFIEDNDMEHTKIQISDGLLKFNKVKHTAPLTFKFLNECLNKCINNEEHVTQIMNFIKEQRTSTYNLDIKRIANKKKN